MDLKKLKRPRAGGKAAPKAKKAPTATSVGAANVTIDFPQPNEKVRRGHYAVRISATAPGAVQISFDKNEWFWCRTADGYFWFDWWPSDLGKKQIFIRLQTPEGQSGAASSRAVTVIE